MDSNGIVDTAKLVRLKRLTGTNNRLVATQSSIHENIVSANDASVLYRNFSGRPDIYDDNEYYLSSKDPNQNCSEFNRRTSGRRTTRALTNNNDDDDDDDILTDAVDIDAFQLPNKLWDEKVPNSIDGFIL